MSEQKATTNNKKLTLFQLVALATGQVIGVGVITTTGLAIAETGKSVWVAYALAVIMGTLWIYPIMYFASMAKYKGGSYTVVTATLGDLWGGIYSIWWIMMFISTAMMGTAIGQYVNAVVPSLPRQAVSLVAVTALFILNLFGVDIMAKVQSFMTTFLVIALGLFVVAGVTKCSPGSMNVTAADFFMKGSAGFMGALILLIYSTSGHNLVQAYSYRAKNPKKNVPLTMLISGGIIFVLYIGVSYVAANVLPIKVVAGKSLVAVSKTIFPTWLFYLFVIGGPIMALLTTLNSSYSSFTAPTLAATDRGWLPAVVGKRNQYGAPYLIYGFMFLCSVVPILFGVSLKAITNYTVMGQRICMSLVCFCGFLYPLKFPEQWKKSWLHMPKIIYYAVVFVSFVTQVYAVFLSGRALSIGLFIGNSVLVIALAIYAVLRYRSGKTHGSVIYTFEDDDI